MLKRVAVSLVSAVVALATLVSASPGARERVSASAPGYVPASQPSLTDSQSYYHIGDSVILTMVKGGVITGTVTGPKGPAIAVGVHAIRVRDEDGKALSAPMQFRERSTDDRGMYRFYGLLPGAYLVAAAKPDPKANIRLWPLPIPERPQWRWSQKALLPDTRPSFSTAI